MTVTSKNLAELLSKKRDRIFDLWNRQLILRTKSLIEIIGLEEIKTVTRNMLEQFIAVLPTREDEESESYKELNNLIADMSNQMTSRNITPSEVAVLIFSVKDAIFPVIQEDFSDREFTDAVMQINQFIDHIGINSFEIYLNIRERFISEQQKAFMEISVPVVRVWHKIIMIPLIGMLDSERTQLMMEILLTALEDTQSKVAILDISGIPVVDTLVARHLITAASAARLMGAECIITGVRSRIAQTLVQLGVDLGGFVTRTTMADGLQLALKLTGQKISE